MASIARSLQRIKNRPTALGGVLEPDAAERVFREHGHDWRERTLSPATTLDLFIRQVIDGNASCGAVRHYAGHSFTAGAYCQARTRLPLAAIAGVCMTAARQAREAYESDRSSLWRGHRTFHLDGTSFSMPDTPPLQQTFGQPGGQKAGCGFPVAHLLVSFDATTGMLLDAIPAPLRTHDLRDVRWIHRHLNTGDVLIGDKAFGSWAHLAMLQRTGLHGVFPLHQRRPIGGASDRTERWPKPPRKPDWMSREQFDAFPESIAVRVVRRTVRRRGFRPMTVHLVTTLLDDRAYPADELIGLGRDRWFAELNIRHLKTTMGLDVLKCKTVDGVLKELAVFCLVYNLVRAVMLDASQNQGVSVDRISFADALNHLRHGRAASTAVRLMVNPLRPGRREPRAIKRRPKEYDRLNRPRDAMRKSLKNQAKAA